MAISIPKDNNIELSIIYWKFKTCFSRYLSIQLSSTHFALNYSIINTQKGSQITQYQICI